MAEKEEKQEEVKAPVITSSRYWWAVMYPENMIDDWEEKSTIQFSFHMRIASTP